MCTLIVLWRCHPSAPLVMALNRDEFLNRPTEPIARWPARGGEPPIVAGRDLLSGGTWFGVGPRTVAALTNHRSGVRSAPGRRSRGELVAAALRQPDLTSVRENLERIDPTDYGPFHLTAADRDGLAWFTNRAGALEGHEIAPGPHVLGNYGMDDANDPVVARMHEELAGAMELPEAALQKRFREILAGHGEGRPCVHLGAYGTRSAAMLWWGRPRPTLLVADGPPCTAKWEDRSELLTPPDA